MSVSCAENDKKGKCKINKRIKIMEPNRTPKQYLIKFTLATNELKIRFQSDYDYSQEDFIPHLYDEIKHLIQLSHDKAKTDEKETIFASNIKLFMDGKEEAIFTSEKSLQIYPPLK